MQRPGVLVPGSEFILAGTTTLNLVQESRCVFPVFSQ